MSSAVDNGGYSTPEEFNDFVWDGDEAVRAPSAPSAFYASVAAKHNNSSSKYIVSSTPLCVLLPFVRLLHWHLHPLLQCSGSL